MNTKITSIIALLILSFNLTEAQQTLNESILHNGVWRQYIVYIPAIYDGTSPVPLMFNFHGYTMTANDQMTWGGDMRPVADTAGFILVYPQGTLFWGSTHWNVGSWTAGSTADDLGFTETMIDTLADNYNIDLTRVYSCGYSNGGYFSFELACQLSGRIAAIGSVGGTMSTETFNACNPLHPTPIVTIHGTADGTVSYSGGNPSNSKSLTDVNTYWANYNNTNASATISNLPNINTSDGSTVEYHEYNNGDVCTSVEHYKVRGGGHDWPGAWGNMDINASAVIWDFVSQYDINGLIACGTTSINKNIDETDEIHIYPNPASDFVTIEMDLLEDQEYHIYSSIGVLIVSGVVDSINRTIDLSGLPSSIYFLTIGDYTVKLIKTE
jgi:polyhydroxybutyrate depolymerase